MSKALENCRDAPWLAAPPSHPELRWERGILAGSQRPLGRHQREPHVFALVINLP